MTYVLLADLFTLRERAKGIALISLVWLFGVSLGPVTGGGFTQSVTWRWTFWICLPFAGISFVLVGLLLTTSYQRPNFGKAVKEVDWIGSVLFVGSLISFLVAISWVGLVISLPFRCLYVKLEMRYRAVRSSHGVPTTHSPRSAWAWLDLQLQSSTRPMCLLPQYCLRLCALIVLLSSLTLACSWLDWFNSDSCSTCHCTIKFAKVTLH